MKSRNNDDLIAMIRADDPEPVTDYIDNDRSIINDAIDVHNNTILHHALMAGNFELIKQVIRYTEVKFDIPNSENKTAAQLVQHFLSDSQRDNPAIAKEWKAISMEMTSLAQKTGKTKTVQMSKSDVKKSFKAAEKSEAREKPIIDEVKKILTTDSSPEAKLDLIFRLREKNKKIFAASKKLDPMVADMIRTSKMTGAAKHADTYDNHVKQKYMSANQPTKPQGESRLDTQRKEAIDSIRKIEVMMLKKAPINQIQDELKSAEAIHYDAFTQDLEGARAEYLKFKEKFKAHKTSLTTPDTGKHEREKFSAALKELAEIEKKFDDEKVSPQSLRDIQPKLDNFKRNYADIIIKHEKHIAPVIERIEQNLHIAKEVHNASLKSSNKSETASIRTPTSRGSAKSLFEPEQDTDRRSSFGRKP